MLCSCTQRDPARPEAPQHDTLAAFDSLMQSQPDSAFGLIYDFYTTHTDLTLFDRHYADLLISEALFKCDYEQTLRTEVQSSLLYFDSLAAAHPKNDDFTILSARSHYMNGVGFMEAESVVEACSEYLKALEIMEEHFEEKEITGYKAKFMALTYNRLGDLFSDQFMTEQAIICFKKSLSLDRGVDSKYSLSKTIFSLGLQYDFVCKYDSALFYYSDALHNLPDTDNVVYRDILANKALLVYLFENKVCESLSILKHLRDHTSDDEERLTRLFTIGNIYFYEKQYDSAIVYLEAVFADTTDYLRQLEAASCLGNIYEKRGEKEKAEKYFRMLAKQTMHEFEEKTEVSQLNSLFQNHISEKQGKEYLHEKHHNKKIWLVVFGFFVLMTVLLIAIIRHRNKKAIVSQKDETKRMLNEKEDLYNKELEEERARHESIENDILSKLKDNRKALQEQTERANNLAKEKDEAYRILEEKEIQYNKELAEEKTRHETIQNAIMSKLKNKKEDLHKQTKRVNKLEKELETRQKQAEWSRIEDFLNEEICQEIKGLIKDENIKRIAIKESYSHLRLDGSQLLRLEEAAEKHFNGLKTKMLILYPKIKQFETDQCLLYLLDLNDSEISILLGKDYTTINKRTQKLKKEFKIDTELAVFVKGIVIQHS